MAEQTAVMRASGASRPATIRLRITVAAVPSDATVEVTDVMLQPGGTVSGWLPHVTELPWSAGVTGGSS